MRRRRLCQVWQALLWIVCLAVTGTATAQTGPAGRVAAEGAPVEVRLGTSAVALHGPWRFHVGDDAAWSQPGFDDRGWETVDLSAPGGDDPESGNSELAAGWNAQGHAGYAGFAWYRLQVQVQNAHGPLMLKMPDAVDDAYQVYVNGQEIGQFGKFQRGDVKAYAAMPQGFQLPASVRDGTVHLAIRVWMDRATQFVTPDAGGLRNAPVLGLRGPVGDLVQLDWDDQTHLVGSSFLESLVLLMALAVAVTHFALMRYDRSYLWLALVVLVTLLSNTIVQVGALTPAIPQTTEVVLRDVVLAPLRIALWVLFWASWFGVGPGRRLVGLVGGLAVLLACGTAALRAPLFGEVVNPGAAVWLTPTLLGVKLALVGALMLVMVRAFRKDRAEGFLALPAVLLAMAASYQHELRALHLRITYPVLGYSISLGQISTILSLLMVTTMGARRFLLAQRRKVQWELEVRQARELQQVIIPRELPQVEGLRIRSDYRPSREVGGDFFQIIPDRRDGSVLVLVGDVTGKGLRAGMLVALIVGVVDAVAQEHPEPIALLGVMNDRLCERGFATATCLIMKISAAGRVSIANAGHLPPYLNGYEVAMEGALPLGTLAGLDYTATELQLQEGDRLVLLTDGVVEARDEKGDLLGFDRIEAMLSSRATVQEVADAAARYGQDDDILVLEVERQARTAEVMAA